MELQINESNGDFKMIQEQTQLIRPSQVCKQLAISSTTLWRLVKTGKLKAPIKISSRAVAFPSHLIEEYIQSKTEATK